MAEMWGPARLFSKNYSLMSKFISDFIGIFFQFLIGFYKESCFSKFVKQYIFGKK
jgi:hypothetical protein